MSTVPLTHDEIVSALRTKIAEGSIILELEDLIAITDAVDRELDSLRNFIQHVEGKLFLASCEFGAHSHLGDGTPMVHVGRKHEMPYALQQTEAHQDDHVEPVAGPTLRTLHAAMLAREFNVK